MIRKWHVNGSIQGCLFTEHIFTEHMEKEKCNKLVFVYYNRSGRVTDVYTVIMSHFGAKKPACFFPIILFS